MNTPCPKETVPVVVVVNDDLTQLRVLAGLVHAAGCSSRAFQSAEEAMEALRTGPTPDLIVTDLYMPKIDGWRLCRLLRSPQFARFNRTPILVVSATFSGDEASRLTTELGANAFLPCPVEPKDFVDRIGHLLRGEIPPARARVLIVEDNESQACTLREAFAMFSTQAEAVGTGAEGLARLQAKSFDVVILDYHLPDMPGDDLLVYCHQNRPEAVVIMVTGDPHPELAIGWMKLGASAYVHKPYDLAYLMRLCENARREKALLRVEDLLERRTQELREQAEIHRVVADFTSGWEYWLAPDGRFRYVSPSAERITGYAPEAFLQDPDLLARMVHPDDQAQLAAHHREVALAAARPGEWEFRIQTRTGATRWISQIWAPVQNREGAFWGIRASNRDITDQKEAETARLEMERRLLHAQKLESLGVMAGGIAHDFNNLLTAILGNLDLARQDLPRNSAVLEFLEHALEASHRAADLTRQMLAYAGKARFEPASMDLGATVRVNSRLLRAAIPQTITLNLQTAEGMPRIIADPSQMQQVVMNLITNAAEAIGDQAGVVTLTTGVAHCDVGLLRRSRLEVKPPPGLYAFVEVADTGCGMNAEIQQRLFDPFFTTKFLGRGLGMSSVLGIVRGHQGAILVDSRPGHGATIRVLFPLDARQASPADGPEAPASAQPVNGHAPALRSILVVDDEEPVRRVCARIVEGLGYQAVNAADGEEALQRLAERFGEIDCVVLDLTMPRLDGLSTFRRMQKICPELPVILTSGYPESEPTRKLVGEGLAGFLQKPFLSGVLQAKIEQALRRNGDPVPALAAP